jgi:UDP-N-acetylglucosamine 4-epimerase
VIPLFIKAVKENQTAFINGDGSQTRDFTFVENAVQANIKALLTQNPHAVNEVYNVACCQKRSLNQLWELVNAIGQKKIPPSYRASRQGDIQDSLADISKATQNLGYVPLFDVEKGLAITYTSWK